MRKAIKRVLIASMLMVMALLTGLLTACGNGFDQEELIKQKGYSICVTYDANGGSFGSNSKRTYALVKNDSLVPAPGYVDAKTQASIPVPTRRNYRLLNNGAPKTNAEAIAVTCWYLAETDENGNVVHDENGNAKLASDTPWNFAEEKATEDVTLVAVWEEVYRYILCLTETDADGNLVEKELRSFIVQPGASIAEKLYNKKDGEFVDRADYIRINEKNYTLLDFYMDKDLQEDFDFDFTHPGAREVEETVIDPETEEEIKQTVVTNDVKIYAKYLSGKFELISKESVKEKIPKLDDDSQWYLLEDVDLTVENIFTGGMETTVWERDWEEFKGAIYGNGYSISGVTVNTKAMKPATGFGYTAHSIFGRINGILEEITFKGVTLTLDASAYAENVIGEQRVSFLAYDFGENGSVKNVTLQDCQIVLANHTKYEARINEETGALWFVAPENTTPTVKIIVNGEEVDRLTPVAQ